MTYHCYQLPMLLLGMLISLVLFWIIALMFHALMLWEKWFYDAMFMLIKMRNINRLKVQCFYDFHRPIPAYLSSFMWLVSFFSHFHRKLSISFFLFSLQKSHFPFSIYCWSFRKIFKFTITLHKLIVNKNFKWSN